LCYGFLKGRRNIRANLNVIGLDPIRYSTTFQTTWLVNIDKFDPSFVLVNINKQKPYVPYDSNIEGLVFEFQGGKKEGTTLETQEFSKESMEEKGKHKMDEGKGSQ